MENQEIFYTEQSQALTSGDLPKNIAQNNFRQQIHGIQIALGTKKIPSTLQYSETDGCLICISETHVAKFWSLQDAIFHFGKQEYESEHFCEAKYKFNFSMSEELQKAKKGKIEYINSDQKQFKQKVSDLEEQAFEGYGCENTRNFFD